MSQEHIFDFGINLQYPPEVRLSSNGLRPTQTIGYGVAIPQGCRANHKPRGNTTYGTKEWIKQIVMTPNAADVPAVLAAVCKANPSILQSDNGSVGCGGVSQYVQIYTADTLGQTVLYANGSLYYVLVANATPQNAAQPNGPFFADEIWVSTLDFDQNMPEYNGAINRSVARPPNCV